MYRLYAAIAVLALVISVTAACFFVNTRTADDITNELEQAYALAKESRTDNSREHIEKALRIIDERRGLVYLFITHKILDDIAQEVSKALECISEGDITPFLVYCRCAVSLTTDLRAMEYPEIANLL